MCLALCVLCCPCMFATWCNVYRALTADRYSDIDDKHNKVVAQVIQGLTNRKFEPAVFKSMSECGICMVEYTESDEITPLPCNVNHYFHSECLRTWLNEK